MTKWVQAELSDELLSEKELKELVEMVKSKLGDALIFTARRATVDVIPNERYL